MPTASRRAARSSFTGGMVGWDEQGNFPPAFAAQARQTLANIVAMLAEGGAGPEHLVRLTWYVVDLDEYRSRSRKSARAYREVMGRHFPAMAVVEVNGLVEPKARLEIEATAVIPDWAIDPALFPSESS